MRFPEDVPVLADGVVTLRAHRPADVEPAYETCQDPEMQRWTTIPVPYTREHAQDYLGQKIPAGWREGTTFAWAIEFDGRYAGTVDLRPVDGGAGEIGFAVAPWARGNGVMTRAVRLCLRHAFAVLGWNRVTWRAFVGNWASRKVAWKTGFHHLVTIPGGGVARGERKDEWVASITPDDPMEPSGNWWTVPELAGHGVRLRAFRSSDVPRIVEACNDERTQYWLTGMPSPYGREDAEAFVTGRLEWLANGGGVSWVIADPDTDLLLGNVSVFDMDNRIDKTYAEVGYWAHPAARGRGVMSAAVRLAVAQAFTPVERGGFGRRRLVLYAAAANTASAHVAEVNGFTLTGTSRAASPRRDGSYDDLLCFDLLATDLAGRDGTGSST